MRKLTLEEYGDFCRDFDDKHADLREEIARFWSEAERRFRAGEFPRLCENCNYAIAHFTDGGVSLVVETFDETPEIYGESRPPARFAQIANIFSADGKFTFVWLPECRALAFLEYPENLR